MTNWMETYTGKRLDVMDFKAIDMRLGDIAHALSNLCRFNGHCRVFYSVAEHSVRVSIHAESVALRLKEPLNTPLFVAQCAMFGLLHDAAEAYLGDIVRPTKHRLRMARGEEPYGIRNLKDVEMDILVTILATAHPELAITSEHEQIVYYSDELLLATEARDLMLSHGEGVSLVEPMKETLVPWTGMPHRVSESCADLAKRKWLEKFQIVSDRLHQAAEKAEVESE